MSNKKNLASYFPALRKFSLNTLALAVSSALFLTFSLPDVTFAADGAPGNAGSNTQGGGGGGGGSLDSTTGLSGQGGDGGLGGSGQGSSSGGGGGAGTIDGATSTIGGSAGIGGSGNNGIPGSAFGSGAGGGGGGGGGVALILSGNGSNSGTIVGGSGGNGGNGGQNDSNNPIAGHGGNGGDGGDGGSGVLINIAAGYDNSGTVRGGNGGSGGNTGSALATAGSQPNTQLLAGSGGKGGRGGDGITAIAGGDINNTAQGVIIGGDGATGGLAAESNATANANITAVGGTGGVGSSGGSGVFLSGVSTVTNAGMIHGGNGGNGNNGGAAHGVNTVSGGNGSVAGDGGTGAWVSGSGIINNLSGGQIIGGNGGTGGGGSSLSTGTVITDSIGGAGGKGGSGVMLNAGGQVTNAGSVTGGAGNRGGGSGNSTNGEHGGNSGRGGAGIEIISDGNVLNEVSGVVTGGNGGDNSAGGGGLGGAGGSGVSITGGGNVTNNGSFTGGNGGTGASAAITAGDGAAGGFGLDVQGAGSVVNNAGATITGGVGGLGGTAQTGGHGGNGGNGVLVAAGGDVTNAGTITGGRGNNGGNGNSANGGNGGIGVQMISGGGSVTNTGVISGGQGGNAGVGANPGQAGAGGVGLSGTDMTIINSGTLSGGFSQDGLSRADAVLFTGGTNTLELRAGYVINGNVDARTGNNTLILGGLDDSTFNASDIGSAAQYEGFSSYHKTGASTWILSGATTADTPWTLFDGILQASQEGSFGASGSSLTFEGGTLQLSSSFDLSATRNITLANAGGTIDTQTSDMLIAAGITGNGGLTKQGSGRLTLGGNNTYSGLTNIENGTVTLNSTGRTGSGPVHINNPATFEINESTTDGAGNYTFGSALSGAGLLSVDLQSTDKVFTFSSSASSVFTGVVALKKSTITLDNTNTTVLSNTMLQTDAGSSVSVSSGIHSIDGVAFNGGTMIFDATIPADINANSLLRVNTLIAGASGYTRNGRDYQVDGTGDIRVTVPSPWDDPGSHNPDTTLNLLQQDEANISTRLIEATNIVGSGGALNLMDSNGNAVGADQTIAISQNGVVVANGLYDYRLTTAPGDGLYVNYGLKELDILNGQTLVLAEHTGATGAAADMSARITGSGNLGINAGNLVSLSNGLNDYSGATQVRAGTLRADADGVLGNTSELNISGGATVDINGTTQAADLLAGQSGSTLNLNGGKLTLRNGGMSAGSLTGSGDLNIDNGILDIRGANSNLSATTNISNGAEVILNNSQGAGAGNIVDEGLLTLKGTSGAMSNKISGAGEVRTSNNADTDITGNNSGFTGLFTIDSGSNLGVSASVNLGSAPVVDNGRLTVNTASDWTLSNTITGTGGLSKKGAGTLKLTQVSSGYTGTTDIYDGVLSLGDKNSSPVDLASQLVNIHDGAVLYGYGSTAGDVNVMTGGTLQVDFTVGGNLTNTGTVRMNRPGMQPGSQLVVNGNYIGNNGLVVFNTTLNGDSSPTDKLTVKGNTSGNTRVQVNNIGGTGARTVDGIQLIEVDGVSAGTFTQTGRIAAGVWDYALVRGTGTNTANWYLTNIPLIPPEPVPTPTIPPVGYRPEVGTYINNLAAANTLFNHRLHDRTGEPQYTDALSNESLVDSFWMRHVGGHESSSVASGKLKTQANRYVLQMGGDFAQWSSDKLDRWHLGAMWGYANEHNNTRSHDSGYNSKGSVTGYSVGLYGTWYQNDVNKQGLYVDSWLLYNWFDNQVKGDGLQEEKYRSKGVTASLESGYTINMGEFYSRQGSLNRWYIQPQAQVVWMDVVDDKHREANGTVARTSGEGNVQTRLGLKTYLNSHHKMDSDNYREFQPYIELNWIHNTKSYGVSMNELHSERDGTRNLGEIRTGVEGKINNHLNLWGNIGLQTGDKGYSDTMGMLGMKYVF